VIEMSDDDTGTAGTFRDVRDPITLKEEGDV
jgi:hypothetical protein